MDLSNQKYSLDSKKYSLDSKNYPLDSKKNYSDKNVNNSFEKNINQKIKTDKFFEDTTFLDSESSLFIKKNEISINEKEMEKMADGKSLEISFPSNLNFEKKDFSDNSTNNKFNGKTYENSNFDLKMKKMENYQKNCFEEIKKSLKGVEKYLKMNKEFEDLKLNTNFEKENEELKKTIKKQNEQIKHLLLFKKGYYKLKNILQKNKKSL